jgi:hypothetical protein
MTTRTRPAGPKGRGRVLVASAALSLVGAVVLTVAAFSPSDDGADEVVLEVDSVTAAVTPSTVPTFGDAEDAAADAEATGPVPGPDQGETPTTTTAPLSPLAALVGPAGSAIPEPITPRAQPIAVVIDDVALWAPVRAVGLEADGQLEVPDETEVGWYRYGATPGRAGATVLAAHVTWNDTIGPFYRLGSLEPGARIEVTLDDGTLRIYEVVERTMYRKTELPRDRIWRTTGDETLVLITCGGDFNPEIRRYRDNIVVYAVPVA